MVEQPDPELDLKGEQDDQAGEKGRVAQRRA